MSRLNLEDNKAFNFFIQSGLRFGSMDWVPVDNEVLDPDSPTLIFANPAGAVDILMPAASDALKGLTFIICNVSANAITLKTSADAAFTTAIVLAAGECTMVICTGSATAALGWRAFATAAST